TLIEVLAHKFRVKPADGIIEKNLNAFFISTCREILEVTHTNVTPRDSCEDGAGETSLLPLNGFTRRHSGKGARRRYTQMVHGLAHDVLANDGTHGRLAVTLTGKSCDSRSLELNVKSPAYGIDGFTKEYGAAIAELRNEMAELMTGIGHGDGNGGV